MNRITTRILPLCLLMLVSCQEYQVRQELLGKWTYDLEATRSEMLYRNATPGQINYMESIMTTLAQAELHFQKGGTLTFSLDNIQQEGEWSVENSGTELIMNLTGTAQISDIEYISSDTLILAPQQVQINGFPRVLVARIE